MQKSELDFVKVTFIYRNQDKNDISFHDVLAMILQGISPATVYRNFTNDDCCRLDYEFVTCFRVTLSKTLSEEIKNRLMQRDIDSIQIEYTDGTVRVFEVPWMEDEEKNMFQTCQNINDGYFEVIIQKG